jgi:hypothetical protein
MSKKNKKYSTPLTLKQCEEKYGPKPESYDEYYFHFQNMLAAMSDDLEQEEVDEIVSMSINDMRRTVMIREYPTQH